MNSSVILKDKKAVSSIEELTGNFIKTLNSIAPEKHRYTVFSDFVFVAAASFRNMGG